MATQPTQPGLADLIDLEYQLLQQPDGGKCAVVAGEQLVRECQIPAQEARRKAESKRQFRWSLCVNWLNCLHRSGAVLPGARIEIGLRATGWILTLLGLLFGGSTAAAALAYDGSAPVNLWMFLAIFVLLQIVLLVLMVLAISTSILRRRAWMGIFSRLLAKLASSGWVDRLLGNAAPESWRQAWQELSHAGDGLQSRRPLYRESERWLLFQLSQRFGLYFNIGAVIVFGWLVMFSDLAFAWSTTPAQVDPGFLASMVETLALPWSWMAPDLVPDQIAIEATRWSRLEGAFTSSDPTASALHAAAWWPFLFLSLLCWGLLPRFFAWAIAGWRYRRSLRQAQLDHAGFQRLYNHMLPMPAGDWAHPDPSSVRGELLPGPESGSSGGSGRPDLQRPDHAQNQGFSDLASVGTTELPALIWGDWTTEVAAVDQRLLPRYGWSAQKLLPCGGVDESSTRKTLAELQRSQPKCVVLIAEGGESPDKRLLRFLTELRHTLPQNSTVLIGLIEPHWASVTERDLQLWQRYLATLQDPYLRVEALT